MDRETGKKRAQRIQLDYYRTRDKVWWWRQWAIAAGLVIGVGYGAFALIAANEGSSFRASQVSTGPVTLPHAHFEDNCEACHQPFSPVNPDDAPTLLNFVGINKERSLENLESKCQACHFSGNHHRAAMIPGSQEMDRNCASCHSDHQGRMHDLSKVANDRCVSCHANLTEHCKESPGFRNVTGFSVDTHPNFGFTSKGEDPGRVKFDHAQHMMPGQVDGSLRGQKTLDSLPEAYRKVYRADESGFVQLDCSDCHTISASNGEVQMAADEELGRYFDPISFEKHCDACHAIAPGANTENSASLPHAAPWKELELLLAANLSGARVDGLARSPGDDSQRNPQPGLGTGESSAEPASAASVSSVKELRKSVEKQCALCHGPADITDKSIETAWNPETPAMIPARWMQHGLYNHAVHEAIACKDCHAKVYGASQASGPANDHEVVMIGGIETCVDCHRSVDTPAPDDLDITKVLDITHSLKGPSATRRLATWGSDSCVLCHRYHGATDQAPPTDASTDG